MACYDVYTLIKIGIDRRGLLQPLHLCVQEMFHSEASKKVEQSLRHCSYMGTVPPRRYILCGNSLGVWSKGNDDFKTRHGITCTSCYLPESVSYRAMGRSILSSLYTLATTACSRNFFLVEDLFNAHLALFIRRMT